MAVNPNNKRAIERRNRRGMDERDFYKNVAPKQHRPIQSLKNKPSPSEGLKYGDRDWRKQNINRDPKANVAAGKPLRTSRGLLAKKVGMR